MRSVNSKAKVSSNVRRHYGKVTRASREKLNNHRGVILWFTGLSGSVKSTLAYAVEEALHQKGCHTFVLDGDNVRHDLCGDLGFSVEDRVENIRRVGAVAKLFMEAGVIVLTAFISPFCDDRERIRAMVEDGDFIEIFCNSPISVCEQRDVKGLYKKARLGEISNFTGISSPYEVPDRAELVLNTSKETIEKCTDIVLQNLMHRGLISL